MWYVCRSSIDSDLTLGTARRECSELPVGVVKWAYIPFTNYEVAKAHVWALVGKSPYFRYYIFKARMY